MFERDEWLSEHLLKPLSHNYHPGSNISKNCYTRCQPWKETASFKCLWKYEGGKTWKLADRPNIMYKYNDKAILFHLFLSKCFFTSFFFLVWL